MRQRLTPPRLLIELVIAAVLLIAAAVGALAWRLSEGPLELDRLTPFVEQALEERFSGLNPQIRGGVHLAWDGPDHALMLVARQLSIGPAGAAPLVLPQITLNFDRIRLLRGELTPKSVTLLRPRFEVERGADGAWRLAGVAAGVLGNAGTGEGVGGAGWLDALLKPGTGREDPLAGFERFGVRGGALLARDEASGLAVALDGVDIGFRRVQGAWSLALAGHAAIGAASLDARATASLGPKGWTIEGKLELPPTELVEIRRIAEKLAAPLPPHLALMDGRIRATATGAALWDGGPVAGAQLTDLAAEARVEGLAVLQEPMSGIAGRSESADLTLSWTLSENLVRSSLRLGPMTLSHVDLPAGSIDLRAIALSGLYDPAADAVRDGRLEIDAGFTTLGVGFAVEGARGPMTTTLEARLSAVSFDDMRKYWPVGVAPNPRRWMLANILRGTVTGLTANAVMARSGPEGAFDVQSLNGTIDAEGMRIQYVPRMPLAEQVAGRAVFDMNKFEIAVQSASVLRQRLQRGRIDITGLHLAEQDINFDLVLAGPLASAFDILDSPPLGYIKRFGIPLNDVVGEVTTRLLVKFPLLNALTFDDVKISAASEARGVKLGKFLRGLDLTDGAASVKVDQNALALTGRVSLLGQPFAVEWAESFARAPPLRRSLTASGDLPDHLRAALGIPTDEFAKGPMGARLVYTGQDGRNSKLSAVLDLRRVALALEPLGYEKPIGRAAELRFDLSLLGLDPQTADSIRFTADGAMASGRGRFSPDGTLTRVDLDRLRIGETDLAASYLLTPTGALISAVGAKLDLRPVLKDKPDKPPEPGKPMRIDLRVASARLSDDLLIADLQGRVEHDGLRTRSADLSARAAGGLLRAALKPGEGGRDLLVEADDAGALMRALGVSESMRGGKLKLTGWYDDRRLESPLQGRVEIIDSRVVGAPILSRLLQLASVSGIPELLSGDGVAFQTIVADFTMINDVLDIKEGRASGLALGVLLRGKVDRNKETLDLNGTLVPIYGLNRVLGAIPLLGDLLTGGDGGGLFAFTFAIRGPSANPDLSVNALSVLAPGLLRRLFEYGPAGGDPRPPARSPSTRPPGGLRD